MDEDLGFGAIIAKIDSVKPEAAWQELSGSPPPPPGNSHFEGKYV
jgi:hypothetical protein